MKSKKSNTNGGHKLQALAQFIGLLLILCGAIGLPLVLLEIWGLYQQPDIILTLAQGLSEATGIDDTLLGASVSKTTEIGAPLLVSYFLAWGVAFILMSLAARVSYLCIKGGSRLFFPRTPRTPAAQITGKERNAEADLDLPTGYRPSHRRKTG